MIELIIKWVSNGIPVKLEKFPYNLRRIIEGSEEILYLLKLFKSLQPPTRMLS